MTDFWDVAPCSLVEADRRFVRTASNNRAMMMTISPLFLTPSLSLTHNIHSITILQLLGTGYCYGVVSYKASHATVTIF
jgi:hypothetical protein